MVAFGTPFSDPKREPTTDAPHLLCVQPQLHGMTGVAAMAAVVVASLMPLCLAGIANINLVDRPALSTWKRTSCGCPDGSIPPGPYTENVDYPGSDQTVCGPKGCVLPPTATYLDCETKCNDTADCVAYVFAPGDCGQICWTKSAVGRRVENATCRNSRVIGKPASASADIPSQWASQVSADTTPLPLYPRPQLVRGKSANRNTGDATTWTNLNGLWEWQPSNDPAEAPPFGRQLNGSILVPFPVESCLSGVAPASSSEQVQRMWYRTQFTTPPAAAVTAGNTQRLLLHFGAIDWQSSVYLNGALVGNHTGGYDGFDIDVSQCT